MTVIKKMIKQERLMPDGRNWAGQGVFFNMPGTEWPEGMTFKEETQFIKEEWGLDEAEMDRLGELQRAKREQMT